MKWQNRYVISWQTNNGGKQSNPMPHDGSWSWFHWPNWRNVDTGDQQKMVMKEKQWRHQPLRKSGGRPPYKWDYQLRTFGGRCPPTPLNWPCGILWYRCKCAGVPFSEPGATKGAPRGAGSWSTAQCRRREMSLSEKKTGKTRRIPWLTYVDICWHHFLKMTAWL